MTKQIIFIFALLCTLQAQASVQPVQKDTVRHTIHYEVAELLQPMQPVYLNGVLLPASRTGNWFVSISGGATVFLGTPLGCEDLFGRVKPSYSLAVGKWFTPLVGARVNYSGLQFKDDNYLRRTTIISMQISCGISLDADMPDRNRYVGGLHPLWVSVCYITPPTGTIPLRFLTAY